MACLDVQIFLGHSTGHDAAEEAFESVIHGMAWYGVCVGRLFATAYVKVLSSKLDCASGMCALPHGNSSVNAISTLEG